MRHLLWRGANKPKTISIAAAERAFRTQHSAYINQPDHSDPDLGGGLLKNSITQLEGCGTGHASSEVGLHCS